MNIKTKLKVLLLGYRMSSETYIEHLRKKGARIGQRTNIYSSNTVLIDESRPWLIDIGDDVSITKGVTILTHGYDWAVLKGKYGDVSGSSGKVKIGNNVFIGMNSIILKGCNIGNNVIIGAGSVVTRDIPDDTVVAGNPARKIMSLSEYHQKRQEAQYEEAAELTREYRKVYKKEPDDAALAEFHWLYCSDPSNLTKEYLQKDYLVGNFEMSMSVMSGRKPMFDSKEAFLKSVKD